jgi:hypothetical protein
MIWKHHFSHRETTGEGTGRLEMASALESSSANPLPIERGFFI